jgi:RNA polymerase II subunit A-like phosphatase
VSHCVAPSRVHTHHSFSESPGWKDFLHDMATKYEMHVYTMGTRAYAEEVCAAIDPDGKLFGGRILSRDESGS